MELLYLPPELLDLILRHLDFQDFGTVCLTCQFLDRLAVQHRFRSIQLIPVSGSIEKWKFFAHSEKLRLVPRHITIHSFPEPEAKSYWYIGADEYLVDWDPEDCLALEESDEEDDEVRNDLKDLSVDIELVNECYFDMFMLLSRFPRVESIQLSFTKECTVEPEQEVTENEDRRRKVLAHFFDAICERSEDEGDRRIRSLTVKHLQNAATDELAESESFLSCLKGLDELNVRVTTEDNDFDKDPDNFDKPEQLTFPPFFRETWLQPCAETLTFLSIYWRDAWGAIPGYFDARGLIFPRLRSLALGQYTIAHHDQLEWIFAQPELQRLSLYDCAIVRYIRMSGEQIEEYDVKTVDWDPVITHQVSEE